MPREIFEATGRWDDYGDGSSACKDRKDADYLLAPTHEELFTLLVKGLYSSYKDFPLSLYQIQDKYRDEARPRAGILRGREFIMKDSYSFDLHRRGARGVLPGAPRRLRADLHRGSASTYMIVFADAGAMGGSRREEFLHPTPVGEDTFVQCTCDYAANTEAVEIAAPDADPVDDSRPRRCSTRPDTPTIETLVDATRRTRPDGARTAARHAEERRAAHTHPTATRELLVVGVPGDREVDLKRVGSLEPVEVEAGDRPTSRRNPRLVKGYIGLADGACSARSRQDPLPRRPARRRRHGLGHRRERRREARRRSSPAATSRRTAIVEVAEIRDGDPAPDGSGPLELARGIELGHVFQLGRKYAEAFGLNALDQNGKPVTVTMGSYGVGVTRVLARLAEQNYDEKGLVWPRRSPRPTCTSSRPARTTASSRPPSARRRARGSAAST